MITQARYTDGTRTATITLERVDTWLEADETVINFPGVVELDGDRLFMTIHWSRHGGEGRTGVEPYRAYLSDDAGASDRPGRANMIEVQAACAAQTSGRQGSFGLPPEPSGPWRAACR